MADDAPQIDEDGYVTLKLAHPLTKDQVNNLRPKEPVDRDHGVGDEIHVTRDYGLAVIESGFAAGVDPLDRANVRRVLGLNRKMQPLTSEELSGDGNVAAPAPLEGKQAAPQTAPPAPAEGKAAPAKHHAAHQQADRQPAAEGEQAAAADAEK